MIEVLKSSEHPAHFETHHENGETIICVSSSGECKILVEITPGYTAEEEMLITQSTENALQAIDRLLGGKSGDIFAGLHIKIGEDITEGGGKAIAEENTVLLNGRKMLLSIDEMREISGAYDDAELAGFADTQRPGGTLEYTLTHEMGHILDGQTEAGDQYHRVSAAESPTRYGRDADEWNDDNKDHEAFAEGFAHLAYGMPVSSSLEASVRDTIQSRLAEVSA
ncbi:MAG: hypothetical protein WAO28_02590 [Candidatus Microsaccharimonas sp.]